MYSTRWCCCPWRGPVHDNKKKSSRGALGPMAALSGARVGVCLRPLSLQPVSFGGGVGGGASSFWSPGVSHYSGMRSVSLQPPTPSFPPGLIKHRWPLCMVARSLNQQQLRFGSSSGRERDGNLKAEAFWTVTGERRKRWEAETPGKLSKLH